MRALPLAFAGFLLAIGACARGAGDSPFVLDGVMPASEGVLATHQRFHAVLNAGERVELRLDWEDPSAWLNVDSFQHHGACALGDACGLVTLAPVVVPTTVCEGYGRGEGTSRSFSFAARDEGDQSVDVVGWLVQTPTHYRLTISIDGGGAERVHASGEATPLDLRALCTLPAAGSLPP